MKSISTGYCGIRGLRAAPRSSLCEDQLQAPASRGPDALGAGVSGFLLKDTEPAELIAAVRVIARGDALLAPSVTRRLIAEFANRPPSIRVTPSRIEH